MAGVVVAAVAAVSVRVQRSQSVYGSCRSLHHLQLEALHPPLPHALLLQPLLLWWVHRQCCCPVLVHCGGWSG